MLQILPYHRLGLTKYERLGQKKSVRGFSTAIARKNGRSQNNSGKNISNLQLEQDDFVPQVTRILEETRMNPNMLNLEITEHVLIDDLELAREKIRALNQLGHKSAPG
jgi:EAL domain-containing protein (putative c-di-GMP-specific phosphodiesterase class I)